MADALLGLALFAGHVAAGIVLLRFLRNAWADVTNGHAPTHDLHPYEVAYLHGDRRHAVATAIAALRLDGFVDAHADGRLTATKPSTADQRAAGAPLDAAIYMALFGGLAWTVHQLNNEKGVRDALDRLHDGLVAEGALIGPNYWRAWRTSWLLRLAWTALGLLLYFADFFQGFPEFLLPLAAMLAVNVIGKRLLRARWPLTVEGERFVERSRTSNAHLNPAHKPSYADLDPQSALLGIAVFGPVALMAYDPVFVQTIGLGRYVGTTRFPTPMPVGTSCASVYVVCSTVSCGAGGSSCGSSSSSCGGGSSCGSSSGSSCGSSSGSSCGGGGGF
ncbi:uncharacterized protein (TIGR04222 family) [Actinomadura pelletieri DSM 43383]|uniref:Uncharacterized protein (TIGR04222 family) n=1 Tax=Actinomadura pelletieri DSM 43383 TaxID=1120940 RepID=A0A495QNT6_9ACTN|nr:TIGR04222 domain-containing membrane protein [Actinomadura pelletieri]RKS74624.1 uncharacterized protein (TIGR04222 family) [Actinomadura pelletieri DSM 43383]